MEHSLLGDVFSERTSATYPASSVRQSGSASRRPVGPGPLVQCLPAAAWTRTWAVPTVYDRERALDPPGHRSSIPFWRTVPAVAGTGGRQAVLSRCNPPVE